MKNKIGVWKKSLYAIFRNNIYSFKYMWMISKAYFFISIFDALFQGIYSPVSLLLTSRLFMLIDQQAFFEEAAITIAIMAIWNISNSAWNVYYKRCILPIIQQKIHCNVQTDLFNKTRLIGLDKYDDPEFYNDFLLAMQFSDSSATTAFNNITMLITYSFTFSVLVSLFAQIDIVIMIIVLISAVISMITDLRLKKIDFRQQVETTPVTRKQQYIDRIYKLSDFAKELRLTQIVNSVKKEFDDTIDESIHISKEYGNKKILLRIITMLNKNIINVAIIALAFYKMAVSKRITIGEFTVVINAGWQLRSALVQLAGFISTFPTQSMAIEKVREFMEYPVSYYNGRETVSSFIDIEFKNVSFDYGSSPILKNINLKIKRGSKIAIVGYNGAGKTTLIKLLMGLYTPKSGQVLYNGTNIEDLVIEDYRNKIGVVFQDYHIFSASVAENILCDLYDDSYAESVNRAIEVATLTEKINELPNGLHTTLTKEFDSEGTNLSGGEAQKIAIARAFTKPFEIIIMDEPSAALDPIVEHQLNNHIMNCTQDKTLVMISHRLSTTRFTDMIYMLEDGRIIESGTHDELMNAHGKYAEMFNVQAKKYIETD